MKNLIVATLISLVGVNNAMANGEEFRFPEISKSLQAEIDRKLEATMQNQSLDFSKTTYLANKAEKKTRTS